MEVESIKKKIQPFLKKYKYTAIILLIGLALMLLPTKKDENSKATAKTEPVTQKQSIEESLEHILSKIEGAGEVDVLLTVSKGEKAIYQTDKDISSSENSGSESIKTVIVTTEDRKEDGLIVQIESPIYMGAVVVSQGANKPSVKLALVEAVAKVTGLGTNQITVLKMK